MKRALSSTLQNVRIGIDEVLLAPKCHAERAGEGVEYVWGGAKGEFRRLSLAHKRGGGGQFQGQYTSLPVGRSDTD